jgi:hypothetical protein
MGYNAEREQARLGRKVHRDAARRARGKAREGLRSAKKKRGELLSAARSACADGRASARSEALALRERAKALRTEALESCRAGRSAALAEAAQLLADANAALARLRSAYAPEALRDRPARTTAERLDDDMRNLPPHLHASFRAWAARRGTKARAARWEEFLELVQAGEEVGPVEVEDLAANDRRLARELAKHLGMPPRLARTRPRSSRRRASGDADIPF